MLLTLACGVEGDVGNLLVLAVDAVGVFGEGVDFDGLTEGVVLTGLVEDGFAGGELVDDLLRGHAGGRGGIEWAEAGWVLCANAVWNRYSGEESVWSEPIAAEEKEQEGLRWRRRGSEEAS